MIHVLTPGGFACGVAPISSETVESTTNVMASTCAKCVQVVLANHIPSLESPRGRASRSGEAPWAPPCYPVCSGKGGRNCSGRAEHESEGLASLRVDLDSVDDPDPLGRFFLYDDVEGTYVCAVSHCPWCGSKLREAK